MGTYDRCDACLPLPRCRLTWVGWIWTLILVVFPDFPCPLSSISLETACPTYEYQEIGRSYPQPTQRLLKDIPQVVPQVACRQNQLLGFRVTHSTFPSSPNINSEKLRQQPRSDSYASRVRLGGLYPWCASLPTVTVFQKGLPHRTPVWSPGECPFITSCLELAYILSNNSTPSTLKHNQTGHSCKLPRSAHSRSISLARECQQCGLGWFAYLGRLHSPRPSTYPHKRTASCTRAHQINPICPVRIRSQLLSQVPRPSRYKCLLPSVTPSTLYPSTKLQPCLCQLRKTLDAPTTPEVALPTTESRIDRQTTNGQVASIFHLILPV